MKLFNKAVLALCFASGGTQAALAGSAAEANVAPPAARDEQAPAPRDGYVWAAGYWDWNGHAYTWVPGHFIFQHRGAHWVADRWDQAGDHWQHVSGHWER
jgi:hypothetical protein